MKLLAAFLAMLLCASGAWAQSKTRPTAVIVQSCGAAPNSAYATTGSEQQVVMDVNGNTCGSVTTTSAVTGFGTLAATNASALLSTATVGPSSAVWPTTPGMIYVKNSPSSAGNGYVCPLGGTCSASVGIPLAPGDAYGFYKPSTSMTVFADSTATLVAQW